MGIWYTSSEGGVMRIIEENRNIFQFNIKIIMYWVESYSAVSVTPVHNKDNDTTLHEKFYVGHRYRIEFRSRDRVLLTIS